MHSKAVENLKTAREQKYYMKIEYEYKFPELHLLKTSRCCKYQHKNNVYGILFRKLYIPSTKCTFVNHELSNITVFAPKFLWAKTISLFV